MFSAFEERKEGRVRTYQYERTEGESEIVLSEKVSEKVRESRGRELKKYEREWGEICFTKSAKVSPCVC